MGFKVWSTKKDVAAKEFSSGCNIKTEIFVIALSFGLRGV